MKKVLPLLILLSCFGTIQSQDIKSSTTGFSIAADFVYGEWATESFFLSDLAELEPSGVGLNFKVGYGINEKIETFLSYTTMNYNLSTEWDRFLNNHIKLGAKVHFGATLKRLRPYLEVSGTNASYSMDPIYIGQTEGPFELKMSGLGLYVGGGLQYFLTPNFALHTNLGFSFGGFTNVSISGVVNEFEENLDYTFFHFHLGSVYYFQ